jgi:hypothetical protein
MSLLARLAAHNGGPQETTGTDALGLILEDADAARAFIAALRTGLPDLPAELRFVTQRGGDGIRPDVAGLHNGREVLYVEGKFWAGLTSAQADGAYLRRLAKERAERDPRHPCPGVLLWVCPPRRAAQLWFDACRLAGAQEIQMPAGDVTWRFAKTADGHGIALITWQDLCIVLEHAGARQLAEDVRQLQDFAEAVDRNAFVPWTLEQITDQETPRRQHELYRLTFDIRRRGQHAGILDSAKRNSSTNAGSVVGCIIHPGGHWTAFRVSPELQARHGISPWWLRWWKGADIAREALRDHNLVELKDSCAVPVPLRAGATREQVVDDTLRWLAEIVPLLQAARSQRAARGAAVADDDGSESPTLEILDMDDA